MRLYRLYVSDWAELVVTQDNLDRRFINRAISEYIELEVELQLEYFGLVCVKELGRIPLPRLEVLNLSYNDLKFIPDLSLCSNLKTLILRNNLLVEIPGLQNLFNLEYLDIRNNRLNKPLDVSSLTNLSVIRT